MARAKTQKAGRKALPPRRNLKLIKPRNITASDGSIWIVKRIGDQEVVVLKKREATRKPRFKRADFVWNPFYRSFKKAKKQSA